MQIFIFVLIILVCVFLALIVLIQNPKGGGLDSSFSSANQIGGVQRTADFLEKSTWTLAIVLFVLCLISSGMTNQTPLGNAPLFQEQTPMNPQTQPMEQTPDEGGAASPFEEAQ